MKTSRSQWLCSILCSSIPHVETRCSLMTFNPLPENTTHHNTRQSAAACRVTWHVAKCDGPTANEMLFVSV